MSELRCAVPDCEWYMESGWVVCRTHYKGVSDKAKARFRETRKQFALYPFSDAALRDYETARGMVAFEAGASAPMSEEVGP